MKDVCTKVVVVKNQYAGIQCGKVLFQRAALKMLDAIQVMESPERDQMAGLIVQVFFSPLDHSLAYALPDFKRVLPSDYLPLKTLFKSKYYSH